VQTVKLPNDPDELHCWTEREREKASDAYFISQYADIEPAVSVPVLT
jgi:hypothetical protein